MRQRLSLAVCLAYALAGVSAVHAAEVTVGNVHLCCGSCEKGAQKALKEVSGVTNVVISRDDETVKFEAKDDAAAQAGLKALAEAGFYGTPSIPGPEFGIDASAKKNEVHISGVHLCCGGCVKSAEAALKSVSGVKSISTQAKKGTMTVDGSGISLADTLKALHEAGFHGKVE